ncbi:MAG: hypothetical protein ACM31D_04645 [Bacteroidota bacterium]
MNWTNEHLAQVRQARLDLLTRAEVKVRFPDGSEVTYQGPEAADRLAALEVEISSQIAVSSPGSPRSTWVHFSRG